MNLPRTPKTRQWPLHIGLVIVTLLNNNISKVNFQYFSCITIGFYPISNLDFGQKT